MQWQQSQALAAPTHPHRWRFQGFPCAHINCLWCHFFFLGHFFTFPHPSRWRAPFWVLGSLFSPPLSSRTWACLQWRDLRSPKGPCGRTRKGSGWESRPWALGWVPSLISKHVNTADSFHLHVLTFIIRKWKDLSYNLSKVSSKITVYY